MGLTVFNYQAYYHVRCSRLPYLLPIQNNTDETSPKCISTLAGSVWQSHIWRASLWHQIPLCRQWDLAFRRSSSLKLCLTACVFFSESYIFMYFSFSTFLENVWILIREYFLKSHGQIRMTLLLGNLSDVYVASFLMCRASFDLDVKGSLYRERYYQSRKKKQNAIFE